MAGTQNPRRTTSAIGKDLMLTALFLMIATVSAFWFFHAVPENPTNIALVYITALVLTARFTNGYFYGIAASVVSVIGINYLFTYPYSGKFYPYRLSGDFHLHAGHFSCSQYHDLKDQGTGGRPGGTGKASYGRGKGKNAGQPAPVRFP